MATALLLIQQACYELGIPAPSSIYNTTDPGELQLKNLLYSEARNLRRLRQWPQQKRVHTFTTVDKRRNYPIPQDFYAMSGNTLWDQTRKLPLESPVNDEEWQYRQYLYTSIGPTYGIRIFGPDTDTLTQGGQFQIDQDPATERKLSFEYITKNLFYPTSWVLSTAYTTNTYVYSDDLILKAGGNGTSHSAQTPEFGRDGTCFWESVPAFVTSANYYVGQYIYANSKVYYVSVGGKAASAPSHTSGSATSGTVTFDYIATPASWVGGTTYTYSSTAADNTYVTASAGVDCYRLTQSGISGQYSPKFRNTLSALGLGIPPYDVTGTITDNDITWTVIRSAYETIVADTDICIFDDDLIIKGIVWRWRKAHDLAFDADYMEYQDMLNSAKSRFRGSYSGSMTRVGKEYNPGPVINLRNWGI